MLDEDVDGHRVLVILLVDREGFLVQTIDINNILQQFNQLDRKVGSQESPDCDRDVISFGALWDGIATICKNSLVDVAPRQ